MPNPSVPKTSINSAPYSSVSKFYHINQFYHWMNTQDHIPTSYYYFTLVPYPCRMADSSGRVNSFFAALGTDKISSLQKAVQAINMPRIQYQSIAGSAATIEAGNITGAWQMVGNTIIGTDAQSFTLQLLNTSDPIVETIIYPWYVECVTAVATGDYPFPRVDFAVNFYAPGQITQNMDAISPMFTYYIMGAFPTSIQAFSPNMQFGSQNVMNRDVTFAFNNLIIVNSSTAVNYKLDFLFNKDATLFPEKKSNDSDGNTPKAAEQSAAEQAAQSAKVAAQLRQTTNQRGEPQAKINWNAFDNLMSGAARYAVSQATSKNNNTSSPSYSPNTRTTAESSYSAPQTTSNPASSKAIAQDLASGTMNSNVYGELKTYAGLSGQDMGTVLKEYTRSRWTK